MTHLVEFINGPVDGQQAEVDSLFETLLCRNGDIEHVYAICRGERCGCPIAKNGVVQYRHVPELTGLVK